LITDNDNFFPFEDYIHSCDEKEYKIDVRKKNYVLKYVTLLSIDNQDVVSLKRLVMSLVFFRNTFTKDSFIYFFINTFNEEEKKMIGYIIFDMFVRTKLGECGDHKMFFKLIFELYKYVKYDTIVTENWEKMKTQLSKIV